MIRGLCRRLSKTVGSNDSHCGFQFVALQTEERSEKSIAGRCETGLEKVRWPELHKDPHLV